MRPVTPGWAVVPGGGRGAPNPPPIPRVSGERASSTFSHPITAPFSGPGSHREDFWGWGGDEMGAKGCRGLWCLCGSVFVCVQSYL